jgi:hypothetical protein
VTATTNTATSTIHRRLTIPPIEIRFTP